MDTEQLATPSTVAVHTELRVAVADAIRQASTRAEHIRLTRISVLVDRLAPTPSTDTVDRSP